ncbi:MAG: P-type DNA transfer ATPase VirB11 [Pseudomonadota bacterium]
MNASLDASPSATPVPVLDTTSLSLTLRALQPYLNAPGVTELCINRPREIFLETAEGWRREAAPFADFAWCRRLAKLVGNATQQRIAEEQPLLSAWLPGGERIQVVLPPATTAECVAITIRRPSERVWSIEELGRRGALRVARRLGDAEATDGLEAQLQGLLKGGAYEAFLRLAIKGRKNILVSGPTGSGKTTWTKAMIQEIPIEERLITIEDARELNLDKHPNHVRLYYSKGEQGRARVTPKQLLEACLRMRPDRILLAELRGEEAFDYLRNVNSGHPGSITSVHAGSAELAFEQLVLLVKQSAGGQALARDDIKQLLYLTVDVVLQFGVERHERVIREIWYAPERRRQALAQFR